MSQTVPAIFIDRDGVIIENRSDHVRAWEDVQIFPQALHALASISSSPYKIVLVTNQAAVARGLLTLENAWEINNHLLRVIQSHGGRVDGIYMCPHRGEDGCDCRKPKPGLLTQAARELHLDLERSVMIGDALTDIQAGRAAGVKNSILLMTGRGFEQSQLPEADALKPFLEYVDLSAAITNLICSSG